MNRALSRLAEGYAQMFGKAPKKPERADFTERAWDLLAYKKTPAQRAYRKAAIKAEREEEVVNHTWRNRRWVSILVVNLLFVASYWLDLQLIEGALTASRVFGFHFADLNSALQVMLAFKTVLINLVIGTGTVVVIYMLFGGRSFCAWVCPYHLLSELGEMLHLRLAAKRLVKDHPLHRATRAVLFAVFAALAFVTGYTVFETISPVGILSRAMTYGVVGGLVWVALLLLIEVFYSRRFWCRYVCPIGLLYGVTGAASPVRIKYDGNFCLHEGKCREVCLVPHVLDITKFGYSKDVEAPIGPDCTRCAMCLDACPTGALSFDIKGLSRPQTDRRKADGAATCADATQGERRT
ncbi:MAG: NapH/MauN family ferredoxin-type protein [Rhizobiales bacterium]|nr:NapH/MauN family ferredoxin-type protein [Hyphomicrobiales bacterium]